MPYNHKQASSEKYPVKLDGRVLSLNSEQVGKLLKKKFTEDVAVLKLFKKFEIDPERLKDLHVEVVDLEGRYAETDDKQMSLDKGLFDGGDFFTANYFVAVHELVHWLSRIKEQDAYFNDPEEVLGFVAAIASELHRHENMDAIWNKIYPKVEFHFNDELAAREFFKRSIEKAYDLLQ